MKAWTTLLDGAERERALRAVNEVAEAMRGDASEEVTLAGGKAGLALLFAELERGHPRDGHGALAERLIGEATTAISQQQLSPWLYSGFSGITWAIERLRQLGISPEEELDEIDDALLGLASRRPWPGLYDLLGGLVGLGVYALERFPRPAAAQCLANIVDRLQELSLVVDEGTTWLTPFHLLSPKERMLYPAGYFDLGAAHGVPAVVALLARIAAAGVSEQKARALATGGARWLLASALRDSPGARFPSVIAPGAPSTPARSAWCSGDPGVALCLLVAARALGNRELERTGVRLAHDAAERAMDQTGVVDASLCHGAAGLGHIYNRMYQVSGDETLAAAARAWFARALDMRRAGKGVGGYLFWSSSKEGAPRWAPDKGLLTGATGVALALLSACHPLTPAWDGVLMAAIPEARMPEPRPGARNEPAVLEGDARRLA